MNSPTVNADYANLEKGKEAFCEVNPSSGWLLKQRVLSKSTAMIGYDVVSITRILSSGYVSSPALCA